LTLVRCQEYIYIMTAVALAAATHSTLTPYLAIPLAVIGTAVVLLRRRRR
jgi:hypothetical protein